MSDFDVGFVPDPDPEPDVGFVPDPDPKQEPSAPASSVQPDVGFVPDDKITSYEKQFAPTDTAGHTFLQNLAYPNSGVIGKAYNYAEKGLDTLFGAKRAPETEAWKAVPDKYRTFLFNKGVPEADLPDATQALQNIESRHPTAATVGQVAGQVVEAAPLVPVAEAATGLVLGATGLEGATGLGVAAARLGIKSITQALTFNGVDAVKEAIIDKNPALAAEHLGQAALWAGGLNLVGGLVGKALTPIKSIAELTNVLPAVGDLDRIQADYLRHWGTPESEINGLTMTGAKQNIINDTEKFLPNSQNMNSAQRGRAVAALGKEAGDKIGQISDQLDQLSEPNSQVKIPAAHTIQVPEDQALESFVNARLGERYYRSVLSSRPDLANNPVTFDEFKVSPEAQALRQGASQTFQDIKNGTINQEDFIKQATLDNPNDLEAVHSALDDYRSIQAYAKAPEVHGDNYLARASGQPILDAIDQHLKKAVGSEQESFLRNSRKVIEKAMDANGKIAPSQMRQIRTEISSHIPPDQVSVVSGLKKIVNGLIDQAKDVSDAKIAGAVGQDGLLAQLQQANQQYRLYKLFGEGTDLINNAPAVGTGLGGHGLQSVNPLHWGMVAGRKVIAPFWRELGAYKLTRARLQAVNALGSDPVAHTLIEKNLRYYGFIQNLPGLLGSIAEKQSNQDKLAEEARSFDGLQVLLGDQTNGLSKAQQYNKALELLSDPNNVQRQQDIASQTGSNLAAQMQQQITKMQQVIQQYVKPLNQPQFGTKNTPLTPTQEQYAKLNDAVRLATHPDQLFNDFQAGTLTKEKVQLVKTLYPVQYQELMQHADMAAQGLDFTYQNRLFYSILHQNGMDPSLSLVPQLQAVAGAGPAPIGPAPHKSVSGNGNRHGSTKGASSYATGIDKLLSH